MAGNTTHGEMVVNVSDIFGTNKVPAGWHSIREIADHTGLGVTTVRDKMRKSVAPKMRINLPTGSACCYYKVNLD